RGLGTEDDAPGGAPDRVATLPVDALTMVRADLDDGQHLTALNEVFVGHPSHQSARYTLRCAAGAERQPSSGVLVATGTGAAGQRRTAHSAELVGNPSHERARYTRRGAAGEERQSPSGVRVATGTGATGWWASLAHDRGGRPAPGRTEHRLGWFVREAWP